MKPPLLNNNGTTLFEVLIAVILMGIILIGFFSISFFSRYQTNSVERRSKVQNELSVVLDEISKNVSRCRGDITNKGVVQIANGCKIRVDYLNTASYTDDQWIRYILNNNRIDKSVCNTSESVCTTETLNVLPIIFAFTCTPDTTGAGMAIQITGRWDATQNPSADNPQMSMQTSAYSFSASIN